MAGLQKSAIFIALKINELKIIFAFRRLYLHFMEYFSYICPKLLIKIN